MTLQQLRYADGVARYGSFNEAANHLYISQPSLSSAIRDLEAEIGISIFDRTSKGARVSADGAEFLGYARQVLEQAELLDSRYRDAKPQRRLFSVSTQHYAFAVNAFVDLVRDIGADEYECTLRETRTAEIIEDVGNLRSEIGVLYRNEFNGRVLDKIFSDNGLAFTELFAARPHVFLSAMNPLAEKRRLSLDDLDDYPCLSFDQGELNSFYFAEEIQSARTHRKSVKVSDRATLFNLLIGLDGYTISTGILPPGLNGKDIVAVPLDLDETISVGFVVHKKVGVSSVGARYIERLKAFEGPASRRDKRPKR